MFKYIKDAVSRIFEGWERYGIFLIIGDDQIGKTTILKEINKKLNNDTYYVLTLSGQKQYQGTYSPFQSAFWEVKSKDTIKNVGESIFEGVAKETNLPFKSLINLLINYSDIRRNNKLLALNDIEKKIVSQLAMLTKKKKLVVLVDNFDYWDEKSRNLLQFLIINEANSILPFLNESKYIITSHESLNIAENSYICVLEPCSTLMSFTYQIQEVSSGYDNIFYEHLYAVTGGNLGLAKDIIDILSLSEHGTQQNGLRGISTSNLLKKALTNRMKSISSNNGGLYSTMEYAAVMGQSFEAGMLQHTTNVSYHEVIDCLSIADQHKLIRKCIKIDNQYEFYNTLIHSFFYDMSESRKKQYHYQLSQILERVRPFDYLKIFYHLYHADMFERSFEMLSIYLIHLKEKNVPIPSELFTQLIHEGGKFGEAYLLFEEVLKSNCFSDRKNKLDCIDASFGILLLLERDYLYILSVSSLGVVDEYDNAFALLKSASINLKQIHFEYWVRYNIFFITFCANRAQDIMQAKAIERELIYELARKSKEDRHWEVLIHILNRNASALYNTEVALIKIKRSYDYFLLHKDSCFENYIFATTNYAGTLIVSTNYREAYNCTRLCLYEIQQKDFYIDRIDKLVSNHIVSGYLANVLSCVEAIELYETLLDQHDLCSRPLVGNNYNILLALNADLDASLEYFASQYKSDAIKAHNDYYFYLFGMNYMTLLIAAGKYEFAIQIYANLNNMVPTIMDGERIEILNRYLFFEQIIKRHIKFSSLDDFSNYFINTYSSKLRFKQPYIFTDQQFWSTI